ncbi:hypothetical protein KL907_004198 [Ogataea polymorpha]|uniref:Histone acetyltransferase n=2 Tax=Ogataea polymorpha TaxID=460523 RepID=A0A9P8T4J5_9ASCO|nr:hypothetical protein KL908_004617 [Ogataea polymorpha]KAG7901528.1 hypothetical protein KL907_004198 [Ogataea polymorpha]KAG7907023.1 hypothetical protein KL906_004209 [Ogataea polymorpha]KAG7931094.1 hypothetical protein KL934_004215 [Ogataea polymorpha]KAH3665329.1 hypothetical protein OGATHE_004145 [Ogataea polymorpha]
MSGVRKSPGRKRRRLFKSLEIPDNKIYDGLHEAAVRRAQSSASDNNSREIRSLRARSRSVDYSDPYADDNGMVADSGKSGEKLVLKIKYNGDGEVIQMKNSQKGVYEVGEEELELPFRGLFSFKDANTYYTRPTMEFRALFAKMKTESEGSRHLHGDLSLVRKLTSEEKLAQQDYELQTSTVSKLRCVHFRNYEIDTWFKSPYPQQYSSNYVLHLCEYCLKYFSSSFTLRRHEKKCPYSHRPPGTEIYRESRLAMFEIDGRKNVVYCQNLCLFAKLFLNSKTLYYDVEPFMFYLLCEIDEDGYHFVGYFSKEKLNGTNYNLSCILTLPIYQRKGYGNFLIDFSYLLSRREFRLGTPEKPLSDLGLFSYRNYWKISVAKALKMLVEADKAHQISVDDICNLTGMIHNDVIVGLEQLKALVRDPETKKYGIWIDMELVNRVLAEWNEKNYVQVKQERLLWKPVILGPSGGINTTSTMVLTTDRENDEKTSMSNISLIINFLRDDLEDNRDLEIQTLDKIKPAKPEFNFERSVVCYPGRTFSKSETVSPDQTPKSEPVDLDPFGIDVAQSSSDDEFIDNASDSSI